MKQLFAEPMPDVDPALNYAAAATQAEIDHRAMYAAARRPDGSHPWESEFRKQELMREKSRLIAAGEASHLLSAIRKMEVPTEE